MTDANNNGSMPVGERLARLELRVDHIDAQLKPIADTVDDIGKNVTNRGAFMAGIAATVSVVWALLIFIWETLLRDG